MSDCGYPHPSLSARCTLPGDHGDIDHHYVEVDGVPCEWTNHAYRAPEVMPGRSAPEFKGYVAKQVSRLASRLREEIP